MTPRTRGLSASASTSRLVKRGRKKLALYLAARASSHDDFIGDTLVITAMGVPV